MKKKTRQMLNDSEQELLRATEADKLRKLDEDALLDLHTRVRRARTKYIKLHRRRAAAQVTSDASRARASKVTARTAIKAEVFEDALAQVSRRLARLAWISADQLREERLAAARAAKRTLADASKDRSGKGTKKGKKGKGKGKKGSPKPKAVDVKRRTPASTRATAAARASTKRKQAKKDNR